MDHSTVKILKWVSGGYEALLSIPILGGSIVIGLGWTPLIVGLALHIVTLVFSKKAGKSANGNILGIVTSCIGWIPIVGMILHILSAIFILIDAAKEERSHNA